MRANPTPRWSPPSHLPDTLPLVRPHVVPCPVRLSPSPSGRLRHSCFLAPSRMVMPRVPLQLSPPSSSERCVSSAWGRATAASAPSGLPPEASGKKEEQASEGKLAIAYVPKVCKLDLRLLSCLSFWSSILRFSWIRVEQAAAARTREAELLEA